MPPATTGSAQTSPGLLVAEVFEEVAHRIQKAGPATFAGFPSAEAALDWVWTGWERAATATSTYDDRTVWAFLDRHTGCWVAFDLGAAADWALLGPEDRYWALFAPLLDGRAEPWRVARGDMLLDLIENMHIRGTREHDSAWALVARALLCAETEEAAGARLLVGLGSGGPMGRLLRRSPDPLP